MTGWLVTNKYSVSDNFTNLKKLILNSAYKFDIDIKVYNNVELLSILSQSDYIKPNFVLFWDKDIKLAKFIENEGIRVFNSSESIRLCDDKSLTYLSLRNSGIRMPKTIFSPLIYFHNLWEDNEFIDFVVKHISFPCVYKECFGSFGRQVYLVNNRQELIDKIKTSDKCPFEIQEFIKTSFGKDIRVYIVGDTVIGGMLRQNDNGDFRANIEIGGKASKYELNKVHIDIAKKVVKLLNLDFAGIDILFGENDEPILCEVNSNAYFNNFNKVFNINVADYIFKYIKNNL